MLSALLSVVSAHTADIMIAAVDKAATLSFGYVLLGDH